jgi:hypothetical protein
MVHLLGRLTNPPAPLMAVFEALPDELIHASAPLEPAPTPTGRLGNGEVKRAVVKVLAAASGPMRAVDIYLAVESLLGCSVPKDSVYSCLSTGARGNEPRFERVSEGVYRLTRR